MTAATFGRWCFLSGWILMALLSEVARLTHWPDWAGVAVVALVGLGGLRLIDRSARQLDSAKTTEHHVN